MSPICSFVLNQPRTRPSVTTKIKDVKKQISFLNRPCLSLCHRMNTFWTPLDWDFVLRCVFMALESWHLRPRVVGAPALWGGENQQDLPRHKRPVLVQSFCKLEVSLIELVSQREYIIDAFRLKFCLMMCLYGITELASQASSGWSSCPLRWRESARSASSQTTSSTVIL